MPPASASPCSSTLDDVRAELTRRLDRGKVVVPVLPRVASQVVEISRDPNRGPADVARLVEKDPALCAKVVGAANSALYAHAGRIASVRQAAARLGMTEISAIALTAAVRASLFRPGRFDADLRVCWRASVTSALFAKEIARARRASIDTAFLCGLLHLVGRAVALHAIARHDPGCDLADPEARAVAREFEVPFGGCVADAWELPAAVASVIQHATAGTRPSAHLDEVLTTRLASQMSAVAMDDADPDAVATGQPAADLNMYPDDVKTVLLRGPGIVAAAEALG